MLALFCAAKLDFFIRVILCPTTVNYISNICNGDLSLSDTGGNNDLANTNCTKHKLTTAQTTSENSTKHKPTTAQNTS